ncbi:uncharacterized protein [Venturia canescens]|uniref:uncharacterized protein n=1 Tax=Venturia canescens TaxID=32260 RepID=UPI001C9BC54D|nr:uncharacterized protein LOC122410823 [Venturia canescens]
MASKASAKATFWNADTVYELGLCRMLAQTLGIWPVSCQDIFSKIRLCIAAALEISLAINLICEIVADCVIVDEIFESLVVVACSIIALLKTTVLRMNRRKMELVIKSAVDDWSMIEDSNTREIMRKYAKTGRSVFIFQMVSSLITIIQMASVALPFLAALPESRGDHFENSSATNFLNLSNVSSPIREAKDDLSLRSFPVGSGCFVNNVSSISYAFVYIFQVIQLTSTCAGNVGIDVYFFSISMHVCGQFELLRMKFENFGQDSDFHTCHEQVRTFVRRHNHLMNLSYNVEDCFNILILAQLSVNTFTISLLGIQLIVGIETGNGASVILALVAIYVFSLQLFLYCYAGDYLTSQIEQICYAVYCSRWYSLTPQLAKDLMFIMCKSNRSFNLTAGKVVSMNLDSFKNIFKAMGSYFSVLRLMFDDYLSATMASKTSAKASLWNSNTVYGLGLCRMLAQTLGIWPVSCQDVFSKMRLCIVAVLEISLATNQILEIVADCVIVEEMFESLAMVVWSIIALLKVILMRMNRRKMELVIKSAVDDWSMIEDSSAIEIMRKHAKTGRSVFLFQIISDLMAIVQMALVALPFLAALPETRGDHFENSSATNSHNLSDVFSPIHETKDATSLRTLPVGTGCLVNNISSISYVLVYIYQVFQLVSTCAGNVGIDVYFFSISMHVCGQFELLRMKFENFGQDSDLRTCHEQVRTFVKRHNHLMELSNNIEDSFNVLILAQLSVNALTMSFLGIQFIIAIKTGNGASAIFAFVSFYILSLQLFLYSYAGDYLMNQIEKIRYAAYCSHWYDLSPSIMKDLLFVMCRSYHPYNLTAGKVICMNLDSFKNIFKAMGSYFSVLQVMVNP